MSNFMKVFAAIGLAVITTLASTSIAAADPTAVSTARKYLGSNPTGTRSLWCARFINQIERKKGRRGTGSNFAKSFARYGRRVSLKQARPGDIVVLGRRGGGHVGYLVAKQGRKVKLISGNSGGRGPGRRVVSESFYDVSRIVSIQRAS